MQEFLLIFNVLLQMLAEWYSLFPLISSDTRETINDRIALSWSESLFLVLSHQHFMVAWLILLF